MNETSQKSWNDTHERICHRGKHSGAVKDTNHRTGSEKRCREKDTDGKIYNVYKRVLKDGRKICLMIDAEKYYQKLISGIHIGTNGYIVVKDAEGTIIMHPKKEQWGIPVIAGRKKMYPDLDYSSLEKMIEDQKKRKEGISHYYSYWWTNEERPRVQKIRAYSPVQIGDSF